MTRTIAICNQKGGVGKTTTTLNLGVGLARQGKRVLLVDADPQSDLTSSLGWNGDRLEKSLGRLMYLATQEYKPAVEDTIIHHPEGNTIALHLDNDFVGISASLLILEKLGDYYVIKDEYPLKGKDYNDYLQYLQRQKHSRQIER